MSVDSIADELSSLAYRLDSMRSHQATTEGLRTTEVLRETAAMLRTRQDFKGVEIDQFKKLNRSRWEGCPNCHRWQTYGYRNYDPTYCRDYGKPLNEQAWAELERRINAGTVD